MKAQSTLLVAAALVLAGGAWFLSRALDPGDRGGRAETRESSSESTTHVGPELEVETLLPSTDGVRSTARATTGAAASEPLPITKALLQVRVVRSSAIGKSGRSRGGQEVEPVLNARVLVARMDWTSTEPTYERIASGATDAGGLFSFEGQVGASISVRADLETAGRRFSAVEWIVVPKICEKPLELHLSEIVHDALTLIVVDRDTLSPIVGARAHLPDGLEPRTTNALGMFEVTAPPRAVSFAISIRASGYYPTVWTTRNTGWEEFEEGPPTDFTRQSARIRRSSGPTLPVLGSTLVRMSRAASSSGRVLDSAGKPVAEAELRMRISFGGDAAYAGGVLTERTDEHGNFAFDILPAGVALQLAVQVRGESTRTDPEVFTLEPGEARVLTLRVRGHVELSGRVLDANDAPISGGKIKISVDTKSDEGSIRRDGTYYLPFAVAGRGFIDVVREESKRAERVFVDVPLGVSEWTFDVRLFPEASVSGHFVDADGSPITSGRLFLSKQDAPSLECKQLGARGEFVFEGVAAGDYVLEGCEEVGARRSARMDVRAGDRAVLLRLSPCAFVAGRVVDEAGGVLPGASVSLIRPGGAVVSAKCGNDGSYRAAVGSGPLWISSEHGKLATRALLVQCAPGSETAVPDLRALATLPVRFSAGRFAGSATVEVDDADGLFARGKLESHTGLVLRAPLGSVRIVVQVNGCAQQVRTLDVRAGETHEVPVVCAR